MIVSIIVMVMVSAGLIVLRTISRKQEEALSAEHYIMRTSGALFWLGFVLAVMLFGIGIYIAFFTGEFNIIGIVVFFPLALACAFMAICTMGRMWAIEVEGENITIYKFNKVRKKYCYNDIDRCVRGTGDMKVYVKDKKSAAFMIDAMMPGYEMFWNSLIERDIPCVEKYNE